MADASTWPAGYSCLRGGSRLEGAYLLRPIHLADAEPIRSWRNDQLDVLRQATPLSTEEQRAYFDDVVRLELLADRPSQVLFTLESEGVRVSYGGLVHIAWEHRRAEVSFLADPARIQRGLYEQDMSTFLRMICSVARVDFGFHRLFTETYAIRDAHIATLQDAGFSLEGTLRDHVIIDDEYVDSLIHGRILDEESQHD